MHSKLNSKHRRGKTQGFTLVELLVALFVFSLISGFAYTSINTMVKAGDAIEAEMTALASLQRAIQSLERDLRQKVVPVVATTETESINLSADNTQLSLKLVPSSQAAPNQAIKEIRYSLKGKTLLREVWKNNKPSTEPADEAVVLLKQVASVEFTALDPAATSTSHAWPAYFQLALEHEALGSIKRTVYFGVKQPELNFSSLAESPPGGNDNGNDDGSLPGKPCPGATNPNC
ncbi:type II secretion system protein J [Thiothrix eikelboomii]|uniref:Type II secretion system protein J n=1 Tax=Thiothrix eikelboomii TaxID=92487 RepID=A0A1T4X2T7_9GAMM|nr:type II secretion system protein GspJ [Thiothrix eikelboomii]SKA83910.1 type II secretion system protein J [Thiothrix eikelboomii]